jgi:hypothetical protein
VVLSGQESQPKKRTRPRGVLKQHHYRPVPVIIRGSLEALRDVQILVHLVDLMSLITGESKKTLGGKYFGPVTGVLKGNEIFRATC